MPSLRQAARTIGESGSPLPMPFSGLANKNFYLRRGQITLACAAPGVGKSVWAQALAVRGKIPTLHLWPDGDAKTAIVRLIQMTQNLTTQEAEAEFDNKGVLYQRTLDNVPWYRVDYPDGPDLEEVGHRLWAYGETMGDFPHLTIVDNLMDIQCEGQSEAQAQLDLMQGLKRLAKRADTAMLVLLHATGKYEEDTNLPIPLGGLMNKVGKSADHVLTLYGSLYAAIVKNRWGARDASGVGVRARLYADYAHMQMWSVEDLARNEVA